MEVVRATSGGSELTDEQRQLRGPEAFLQQEVRFLQPRASRSELLRFREESCEIGQVPQMRPSVFKNRICTGRLLAPPEP